MTKVFITGATGFVGKSLLDALIKKTDIKSFILLVRNQEKARMLLGNELKIAKESNKTIMFYEGDIVKNKIGITQEELDSLESVSEVYHLASNISLSSKEIDKEMIFNVNLDGTRNILEIFKYSKKLRNFYYFSSAYACGKAKEIIKEDWFGESDSFRNYYEESKYLSEQMIKEYINNYHMPIIIFRPSIISAGSESDFNTLKNQTFYYFSRVLKKAVILQKTNKSLRLIGKENSTSNIIPLNNLIKILLEIIKRDNKKKIYNLVNSENISTNSFINAIEENLSFEMGFVFREKLDYETLSEEERFIYDRTKPYFEYNLIEKLQWNCSNTKDIKNKLNVKDIDDDWIKNHIKKFFSFLENEK